MSLAERELESAQTQSEDARKRLTGTMVDLQSRLSPKTLAKDAIDGLKEAGNTFAEAGIDTARNHPGKVAGAAAALGLVLLRKPIIALFGKARRTAEPKPRTKRSIRQTEED